MNFDTNTINPLVAFMGGLITFFASCLLPLVPTYLAYITGSSLTDPTGHYQRWKSFRHTVFFVFGFVLSFVILGATLNRFAAILQPYRLGLEKIGGVIFILFGLSLLGWRLPGLGREWRWEMKAWFQKWPYLNAFVFGVIFAVGWTPCIGPLLAVILLWAAHQETMWQGIGLLTMYGLGLGTPFLLTSVLFESIMPWWKKSHRLSRWAQVIAGLIIMASGLLLLTNVFQVWSMRLLQFLDLSHVTM
jgi:cytochrome c-type biogenesis protein